ncbi:MAG TPA: hypothetical protein IGS37_02365 [Synechococcales cyanobacterium M55_K2018_004]|nr:hypothetical protein [Synechococcales cyanobacterium M55_K2018_004]
MTSSILAKVEGVPIWLPPVDEFFGGHVLECLPCDSAWADLGYTVGVTGTGTASLMKIEAQIQ